MKLRKLNVSELLDAAKGTFEVDVTEEVERMLAIEREATRTGLATKGDSNTDARLDAIEAAIKAIPTIDAQTLDVQALGEIVKVAGPDFSPIIEAINGLKSDVNALRSEMTTLAEKAAQAVVTAEAIKQEVSKAPAQGTGFVTPEMRQALMQTEVKSEASPFGRNVLTFG